MNPIQPPTSAGTPSSTSPRTPTSSSMPTFAHAAPASTMSAAPVATSASAPAAPIAPTSAPTPSAPHPATSAPAPASAPAPSSTPAAPSGTNPNSAVSTPDTAKATPATDSIKSAQTAGLLAIFLGTFGAHDWYLQKTKAGILHLSLFGGGLLLYLISSLLVNLSVFSSIFLGAFFGFLSILGLITIAGDFLWGVAEGVIFLIKGDADLANQGYRTALSQRH